jgi:hypothetical protein
VKALSRALCRAKETELDKAESSDLYHLMSEIDKKLGNKLHSIIDDIAAFLTETQLLALQSRINYLTFVFRMAFSTKLKEPFQWEHDKLDAIIDIIELLAGLDDRFASFGRHNILELDQIQRSLVTESYNKALSALQALKSTLVESKGRGENITARAILNMDYTSIFKDQFAGLFNQALTLKATLVEKRQLQDLELKLELPTENQDNNLSATQEQFSSLGLR